MRRTVLIALILGFASVCVAQDSASWGYVGKTGPLEWGKLNPAYRACSKGHEQSPLNIHEARLNKSLRLLEFHYLAGPVTLENTGNGLVAHVDKGSFLVAGGVRYELVEIDFHHPSEHSVKGKLSDMEADLVHRSEDGKVAIVSVRLNQDRGDPNAMLATLWAHLPTKAGATEKVTDMVSAGALLPGDPGYWTYMGSELTPPCTEGVRWYVFEQDLSISRSQFRAFAALFKMNTRPVQDAHGRRIEANE